MTTNALDAASALSDQDLLSRLDALAGRERESTAELVAHLAVLDSRPSLYLARGHGSLFAYCVEALRLSEDAACSRIEAARACRRFPVILEHLASGSLSLSSVRRLARHLTPENHEAVLARARGRRLREVEALVAELAPQRDAPASVRRVPERNKTTEIARMERQIEAGARSAVSNEEDRGSGQVGCRQEERTRKHEEAHPWQRAIVKPTAPRKYRVQFTMGQDAHDRLRQLQDLLRREIPSGDAGAIVERALSLLLEEVEKEKLGAAKNLRPPRPAIRRATDSDVRTPPRPSRHIPAQVRRVVWARDGGRCAFVSADGHRCTETSFLELHHLDPWARRGAATVENIALRCRRHNQHEAELAFGARLTPSAPIRHC